ncbi:hypothetical protein PR048_017057 [Dryococelus australis]|uniref:Uncharacterized protein n=1 Tax=Dryococelus australis TaxID=614101 RepID=A0ABQ9H8I0_9NEOP|nr:hypothetical protein PR048_017057 [Dryococelus australis]
MGVKRDEVWGSAGVKGRVEIHKDQVGCGKGSLPCYPKSARGRGDVVVRQPAMSELSSVSTYDVTSGDTYAQVCTSGGFGHSLSEPGSNPGSVATGFSHVGIVPDDAAGRISRFPPLLHTHLASPFIGSRDLDVQTRPNLSTRPGSCGVPRPGGHQEPAWRAPTTGLRAPRPARPLSPNGSGARAHDNQSIILSICRHDQLRKTARRFEDGDTTGEQEALWGDPNHAVREPAICCSLNHARLPPTRKPFIPSSISKLAPGAVQSQLGVVTHLDPPLFLERSASYLVTPLLGSPPSGQCTSEVRCESKAVDEYFWCEWRRGGETRRVKSTVREGARRSLEHYGLAVHGLNLDGTEWTWDKTLLADADGRSERWSPRSPPNGANNRVEINSLPWCRGRRLGRPCARVGPKPSSACSVDAVEKEKVENWGGGGGFTWATNSVRPLLDGGVSRRVPSAGVLARDPTRAGSALGPQLARRGGVRRARGWILFLYPPHLCRGDEKHALRGPISSPFPSVGSQWKQQAGVEAAPTTSGHLPIVNSRGAGIQGRGEQDMPEKTRQPATSSGTIPPCENPGLIPRVSNPGAATSSGAAYTPTSPRPFRVCSTPAIFHYWEVVIDPQRSPTFIGHCITSEATIFCTTPQNVLEYPRVSNFSCVGMSKGLWQQLHDEASGEKTCTINLLLDDPLTAHCSLDDELSSGVDGAPRAVVLSSGHLTGSASGGSRQDGAQSLQHPELIYNHSDLVLDPPRSIIKNRVSAGRGRPAPRRSTTLGYPALCTSVLLTGRIKVVSQPQDVRGRCSAVRRPRGNTTTREGDDVHLLDTEDYGRDKGPPVFTLHPSSTVMNSSFFTLKSFDSRRVHCMQRGGGKHGGKEGCRGGLWHGDPSDSAITRRHCQPISGEANPPRPHLPPSDAFQSTFHARPFLPARSHYSRLSGTATVQGPCGSDHIAQLARVGSSTIFDKIDFKRVYTGVIFAIDSEFIRHALNDSAPIADLQGNKKRIPYCQMWGNTGATANNKHLRLDYTKECGVRYSDAWQTSNVVTGEQYISVQVQSQSPCKRAIRRSRYTRWFSIRPTNFGRPAGRARTSREAVRSQSGVFWYCLRSFLNLVEERCWITRVMRREDNFTDEVTWQEGRDGREGGRDAHGS